MGCGSSTSSVPSDTTSHQPNERPDPPEYVPFDEFPTYTLLAKAQREYAASRPPRRFDTHGLPQLSPPLTPKAMALDMERIATIDKHARNAPAELTAETYQGVVAYLTKPAKNEVEKVRAIFVWIANQGIGQVSAGMKKVENVDINTPMFWLLTIVIKDNAYGYHRLLSELCSAANITNRVIENVIVKGSTDEVGDEELGPTNMYCLVHVDGAWRIIDQHWGSQAVSTAASDDWVAIAGRDGDDTGATHTVQVYHQCDDFWFLTDPEVCIYDHWPQNPDEQLLARPVTKTEFLKMARLSQQFFKYGLTTVSHPRCKIEVTADEQSSVKVQIGLPPAGGDFPGVEYVLYKSRHNDEQNVINGFQFKDFVLVEYIKNRSVMQFTINLPKYGRYKLELGEGGSSFNAYCKYLILNERPRYFEPYPRISSNPIIYGTTAVSREVYGFYPVNDAGAVVEAMEGMIELAFVSNWKTNITHRLSRIETTASSETDNISQVETTGTSCYHRNEQQLTIFIKFQMHGQYILEVLSKEDSALLCRYLINSDRACDDTIPFPLGNVSADGAFGAAFTSAQQLYVRPASHVKPMFEWDSKDGEPELAVQMLVVRDGNFSSELVHCPGANTQPLKLQEYAHCERAQSNLTIFVRFSRHGMHKLNVLVDAKVVYQYLINVGHVGADAVLPFPSFNKSVWKNDFSLLEPRTRDLLLGADVLFRMSVTRRADKVAVVQSTGQRLLDCPTGDGCTWEGTVRVEHGSDHLDISSTFTDDGSQEILITYKILNKDEMDCLTKKQAEFANEANNNIRKRQRRRRLGEKNASERKMELDKRIQEVDDDFIKNFDKIVEEDKNIEKKDKATKAAQLDGDGGDEAIGDGAYEDEHEPTVEVSEPGWKNEYSRLQRSLAVQRMRDAAIRKDTRRLEKAIKEFRQLNVDEEDEVVRAEAFLSHLTVKQDRRKEKLHHFARRPSKDDDVSSLSNALKAVRQLNHPRSEHVHVLIQTFLLLYGVDEYETREWKLCRRFLTCSGPANLKQQITNFSAECVHPAMCARCVEMFSTIDVDEINQTGAEVRFIYALAKQQIEAAADVCEYSAAATINKQRALYLKSPIPERFLPKT